MRKLLVTSVTDAVMFLSVVVWMMAYGASHDRRAVREQIFAPLVTGLDTWQIYTGLFLMPMVFVGLAIRRVFAG